MKIEEFVKTENYEEKLQAKGIKVRHDGPYTLLKYGSLDVDFSDEIVKQCRGIIFRGDRVVCKPFDKFFNVQESFAEKIDWKSAVVTEKIDGSLCCLWFDDGWHFSTSGTINADDAEVVYGKSFGDIIRIADNYKDIPFESLNKDMTYMFEIVSPFNQIVIKYPKPHLYHIATRGNDGVYHNIDIGIEKPKTYPLTSLNDCITAVNKMNPKTVNQEGFVVHDSDWKMIKIKSPEYVMHHHYRVNSVSKQEIIEMILNGNYTDVIKKFPMLREQILETKVYLSIIELQMEKTAGMARLLYEEYDRDRKATAEEIKKLPYPDVGFWALSNDGCATEYLQNRTKWKKVVRLIEDFKNKHNFL